MEAEPAEAAPVCMAAPVNVATFDGGATWSCTQAACEDGGIVECGGDCTCNAAVFSALLCVNDGGKAMDCFTTALTPVYMGTIVPTFANCLRTPAVTACTGGAPPGDGGHPEGGDAAPPTDSGSPMDAADGGG